MAYNADLCRLKSFDKVHRLCDVTMLVGTGDSSPILHYSVKNQYLYEKAGYSKTGDTEDGFLFLYEKVIV